MKLSKLLERVEYKPINKFVDYEIADIVSDTRKVSNDILFVAIKGKKYDSHTEVEKVAKSGAKCIVLEEECMSVIKDTDFNLGIFSEVSVIMVKNSRLALGLISAAFFGYPSENMLSVAVTGTKGKTSTAAMVKSLLEACGYNTGVIGTTGVFFNGKRISTENTTPFAYDLQKILSEMKSAGVNAFVMEASSLGLITHRTAGIHFKYGIFTNLGHDHIGDSEHETFEEYLYAKSMLFDNCDIGILNADDPNSEKMIENKNLKVFYYGTHNRCSDNSIVANDVSYLLESGKTITRFKTEGLIDAEFAISSPGEFAIYNSLSVLVMGHLLGVKATEIQSALDKSFVEGRTQPVFVSDKFSVIVDYAHNAMSLESVIKAFRVYNPGRIVTVFGCGGNRPRDRRFSMGEVSGSLSDLTIITSDNPRYEEPEDIINDIVSGINRTRGSYITIVDRVKAIEYAIRKAKPNDIILVAGKGHEDYQEIKGVKYHMKDAETIEAIRDRLYDEMVL